MKKIISTCLLTLALISSKASHAGAALNPFVLAGVAVGAFFTGAGSIFIYQGLAHRDEGFFIIPGLFSFMAGIMILDSDGHPETQSLHFKRIEAQSELALSLSEKAQAMIPEYNSSVPFVNLALDQLNELPYTNQELTEEEIQKAFQENLAQLGIGHTQFNAISMILTELNQKHK
ncbi:MAG: hypothetical protein KDD61_15180 [Bdellovibrionales bacterium]|nr:hypothetical protein [Bdellovibrionales bacterium]